MAIVANKATAVGDVIYIQAEVPILGLLALTDFMDTVTGETVTKYFEKTFRYSLDGINWSYWQPLTVPNVQAVQIDAGGVFKVEYQYKRIGDPGGDLGFTDVTLDGIVHPKYTGGVVFKTICGPAYNKSVFAQFFACIDIDVMNWCLNVLEKLYRSGIVPQYITRGENSNQNLEDKDYIDFWRSIACYFALFVKYARTFETFYSNTFLLREFLHNRGIFTCTSTQHIELLHLMNHFWNEMRQRGMQLMLVKKGETLSDGRVNPVDGEFLRLICYKVCNEFIFSLTEPENTSWNIGNSSPLYTGLHNHRNVYKGYDTGSGALSQLPSEIDLAQYPLVEDSYISVIADTDNNGNTIEAIQILNTNGVKSGIGLVHGGATVSTANREKSIIFDPCLDYEITFMLKCESGTPTIDLAFYSYTEGWVGPLDMFRADATQNAPTELNNIFFEEDPTTFTQPGRWYMVRAIVFGLYSPWKAPGDQQGIPNINLGHNLHNGVANIQNYPGACHCFPSILVDTGATGDVRITDFAMRPVKTEYSSAFINANRWINIWAKNNNKQYTQQQVENIIRYYMIPYNSVFKMTEVNSGMTGDHAVDYAKWQAL